MKIKNISQFSKRGFTLIELLIVIAIIGILASITLVNLSSAKTKARTSKTLAGLAQVHNALEAYYAFNGSYPVSSGWQGYCSAWGGNLGDNWIPELTTEGFSSGKLPIDPRNDGSCWNNAYQIIYYSNGADYKLISHYPESMAGVPANLVDPARPTWAYGYWTPACSGC